jgi:predicted flap endonuclease-1-like 5' DNA nuclease
LASSIFNKVGWLKTRVSELTTETNGLNVKVNSLHEEATDLRVRISQLEASLEEKEGQIRKLRNDLMICEGERNVLKSKGGDGGAVKAAAVATVMFMGTKYKADDLKIVEGIGPKIADLLNKAGINTWNELANTAPARIKEILDAAGPAYQIHDPGTWPDQARLADNGDWDALKKMQEELDGGRK